MAIQQNKQTVPGVADYSKIPAQTRASLKNLALLGAGIVDHSLGRVTLVRGVPLAVTPAIDASIVQNTMSGRSQLLLISEHGQPQGTWLSIPGMSCVEFDKSIYLMQNDYDEYSFPIASK